MESWDHKSKRSKALALKAPAGGNEKKPKEKPMSKKVATAISQCSSKLTEILSWKAKLQENTGGLMLVFFEIDNKL